MQLVIKFIVCWICHSFMVVTIWLLRREFCSLPTCERRHNLSNLQRFQIFKKLLLPSVGFSLRPQLRRSLCLLHKIVFWAEASQYRSQTCPSPIFYEICFAQLDSVSTKKSKSKFRGRRTENYWWRNLGDLPIKFRLRDGPTTKQRSTLSSKAATHSFRTCLMLLRFNIPVPDDIASANYLRLPFFQPGWAK